MTITITAFERSPDGGKGLARDTRVRWALEEVGQPYKVRLVSFRAMKEPAHLALHPFGQIACLRRPISGQHRQVSNRLRVMTDDWSAKSLSSFQRGIVAVRDFWKL